MSSFKNFAPMLSNLQRQADGRGTLEGSSIDDFLSIAGYGDGGGGGSGGISNFDGYNFVISQEDSEPPVLEKGVWADVFDALRDMKTVVGLYVWNSTPDEYHNTQSICVPLTYTYYYNSVDVIIGMGLYYDGDKRGVEVEWNSPDTLIVTTRLL